VTLSQAEHSRFVPWSKPLTALVDPRQLGVVFQPILAHPDRLAFRFVSPGRVIAQLSYGELDRRARSLAAELIARGLSGKRALLLYAPGLEFVVAFFACLNADVTAVPCYPADPLRLARTLPRSQAVARSADVTAALTTEALLQLGPMILEDALTYNVLSAMKSLALPPHLGDARPKRLRFSLFAIAGRLLSHAGPLVLRIGEQAERIAQLIEARMRLFTLSARSA
jgi:non-ribosomal peptide synthetase component F